MPKQIEIKFTVSSPITGVGFRELMDGISYELLRHWRQDKADGLVHEGLRPVGRWVMLETDPEAARDPDLRTAAKRVPFSMTPAIDSLEKSATDLTLPVPTPTWRG